MIMNVIMFYFSSFDNHRHARALVLSHPAAALRRRSIPIRRQLTSAYRTQIAGAAGVGTSNVTILGMRPGSVLFDSAVDMNTGDDPSTFAVLVRDNPESMFAGLFVFNGGKRAPGVQG